MSICEFSGEETDSLIKVEIAGAIMNVAPKYANLGTLVNNENVPSSTNRPSFSNKTQKKYPQVNFKKSKIESRVVDNASSIIQSYISKNNLTIKHICHNANIKEGSLQKMLSGKIQFDIKIAKQIEKAFKLNLTQEVEINEEESINPQDYFVDEEDNSSTSHSTTMEELLNQAFLKKKK